jgi:peroxiredoxin
MRSKICSLFVVILASSCLASAAENQEVKLEKKILPSNGKLEGISNIFFRPLTDSRFQCPRDWKDIEIASILDNKAFVPINALRFKETSGQIRYVVDTDGDMDCRNEIGLQFQQIENLQIADTVISVQPVNRKEDAQKVCYQVIASGDGYTYARISEYRRGEIRSGSSSYGIFLRPRSRNKPLYALSDIVCLIDIDRDGSFSSAWRLSTSGKVSQTEEIDGTAPFILDTRKMRIVQLDAGGTHLTIARTNEETSISPGFKAPDFALADFNGKVHNLRQLRGKVVFLEFWSVSCPFCKKILPQVNSLIKSKEGTDFVALAIAREGSREEIETHLKENPRNACVVPNEKSAWQSYNSQGITPTFYLIDRKGVVRFSGYGASTEQIRIIERLIDESRAK